MPRKLAERKAYQLLMPATAATLETELEWMEGRMSLGEKVDLDCYGRLAGHVRRILETIGVQRKARDVTPSLDEVVARIHARKAAAEADKSNS